MIHPDDARALRDWPISGPQNKDIAHLVAAIADRGIRLSLIEGRMVLMLANWLDEISQQQPMDTDNG
jgi:hypothetical protein